MTIPKYTGGTFILDDSLTVYDDPKKHMGPGDHPSGSGQDVHAGGTSPAEIIEQNIDRIERQKPYKKIVDKWLEAASDDDVIDVPELTLPNNPNVQLGLDILYLRPGGIETLKATQQQLIDMLEEADQHDLSGLHRIFFGIKRRPHPHRAYGSYNPRERIIDIRLDALHENPRDRSKPNFHADIHHEAVITHEIAHLQHDSVLRETYGGMHIGELRASWERMFEDSLIGPERRQKTAAEVSGYASTEPIEFVAETFAGVRAGKTYSDRVMSLYRRLDGPPLPKPKEWWEF